MPANATNTTNAANATNPTHPTPSLLRPSSSPQQHQHQQAPQRSVTISRRQFGPVPVSALQAASSPNLVPTNTANRHSTPTSSQPEPQPPKSPQSTPISTSPAPQNPNYNISFLNGTAAPTVACPICSITLRNLAQLNHHLDTIHPEEPDDVKSAVSQFFRNAQKVFNPITKSATTTLRKIQDLDLDSAASGSSLAGPPPPGGFQGWTDPRAEAIVTKRHWVRESDQDECFHPSCEKRLGIRYGRQHCRRCGNMFCESHSSFQIKLNAQAKHDPNGLWCRVCEACYLIAKKEEDGMDSGGVQRNLTKQFLSIRIKNTEKKQLEVNRLEKRIEKLAQIHRQYDSGASSSPTLSGSPTSTISSISSGAGSVRAKGLLRSVTSRGQNLKGAEQTVVNWEDDSAVPACYICLSVFTRYGNRKHHCRLCGRVICDNCSKAIPLYLNMSTYPDSSGPTGQTRACKECVHIVFKRREHAADQKRPSAVLKYYESLMRLKARIDVALPRFQEMISALGHKVDMHQAHPDYQLAAKTRKELLDDFALFDSISKKIAKMPAHTQHQKQLYNNLYWWATQYLQTNMFPLSVIPKVFGNGGKDVKQKQLLSASPSRSSSSSPSPSISSLLPETTPQDNEAAIESLALISVMEEQRRQIESYIEEATRKRRFDDVKSLQISLEELDREIAAIRSGKKRTF